MYYLLIAADSSPWPTNFTGLHNGSSDQSYFERCGENGKSTTSVHPPLVGTLGPDRLCVSLVVLRRMAAVDRGCVPIGSGAIKCIPGSHRW